MVLAYSGGLDTSVILKWLLEQGLRPVLILSHNVFNERSGTVILVEKY
ncbi:MAG: argininosuccinate synthase [Desulfobacterales bacterium]